MSATARTVTALASVLWAWVGLPAAPAQAAEAALPHIVVTANGTEQRTGYDGVVEAVRQTVIAAQVPGTIVALEIKAGDSIKAGQIVARIDAKAAEQNTAASEAQVQAARAALEVATRDVERQRQLFQKRYISEAALDRAEAQFKSTQAQVNSQLAQAGVARTQTGFYVVRAPYAGIVSDVPVALGDMALPGRAIATIYDPTELRVAASIPQTALASALQPRDILIEISGTRGNEAERIAPVRVTALPTVDPNSHTTTLRLDLPPSANLKPGTFARAWITARLTSPAPSITIPTAAIVRRAELTAVYVLDSGNRPLLRQVRLGRSSDAQVEVLAGVAIGDRVVTQPQLATRSASGAR